MSCECDKQHELAVQGDAGRVALKHQKLFSGPERAFLKSLLCVLRCMTNEHQLDMRTTFAQLGELQRRLS